MHKRTSWQLAAPQFLELAKFQIRIYVKRIGCKHLIAVKMIPKAEFETTCQWIKFLKEREHLYFNLDVSHLQRSCIGWLLCNYEEHQTIFTCTKSQKYPHIVDDDDGHIGDNQHSWSKWFWSTSNFIQLEEELVRQRVARKWYLVVIGDCPT